MARILLLDSHSTDKTATIARNAGAEVIQFDYQGGYPKKRQWALNNLELTTPWVLLLDADEVVPPELVDEIENEISKPSAPAAFLITKGFHFLGRRMRFGGFSHSAVLLFRPGHARFEQLIHDPAEGLDMEVHERLVIDGPVGQLRTDIIHEDFKNLEAYIDRHNKYSTWEAAVRYQYLQSGTLGTEAVHGRMLGNVQERRRFLKMIAIRLPLESPLWFFYHYFLRLGFLEGRRGLIASQIRSHYIAGARAKLYELQLRASRS